MMHLKLAKGTITHYCGALKGTIVGGLQIMFSPIQPMPMQKTNYQVPSTSCTSNSRPRGNLDNEVCNLAIEPMTEVGDNHILMEHLVDMAIQNKNIPMAMICKRNHHYFC